MKLRNKKTGEVVEAESCNSATGMIGIYYEDKNGQVGTKDCFETLAELNSEWEDYEPLIEDKNVRELVRNWLMINKVDGAFRHNSNALRDGFGSLLIVRGGHFENLKSEAFYTTEELCGEGEE